MNIFNKKIQNAITGFSKHLGLQPKNCFALLLAFLITTPAYAVTGSRTSAFEYDANSGLLTKEIIEPDDPKLCLVTIYTYDDFGNKNSVTSRNCNGTSGSVAGKNDEAPAPVNTSPEGADAIIVQRTSTTTYDTLGRFPLNSTNALGHTETKSYNGDFGTIAKLTGPNSLDTTWQYDTFGRPKKEIRADGTSTTTTYTVCGVDCPANGEYTITKTQDGAPTSKVTYDMRDRVILTETPDIIDANAKIYTAIQYDDLGRESQKSRPYKTNTTPVWTQTQYDIIGRPTVLTVPDDGNQATGTSVSTMTYSGFVTSTTNALGQTKSVYKNSQNQVVKVTDAALKNLTFKYDAFGNLINTIDAANNITTVTYDKRGRKISLNDPDQGIWTYRYNVLGELKTQIDAKQQTVTFKYDVLGRMTQRNETDLVSTWDYDTCDLAYSGGKCVGKVVHEIGDNGSIRTYVYDAYSRPTSEIDKIDNADYGVTKSYDLLGRIQALTYPNGFGVKNIYSSTTSYLTEVQDSATQASYWKAKLTDNEGRVSEYTYGNGTVNDVNYFTSGFIRSVSAGTVSSSTSISNQTFRYDSIGNLTYRYDAKTGIADTFTYDALNRLKNATASNATNSNISTVTVNYDDIGNITSKSDVGTYAYTSLKADGSIRPHAVSNITMNDGVTPYAAYTYDANGNMWTGAGRTVTLNSWNMPNSIVGTAQGKSTPTGTSSSTYSFVYNVSHERVKEIMPDGTVIRNLSPRVDTGFHVEIRQKPDGTTQYVYSLYAGGMPFGTKTDIIKTGTATVSQVRYFHTDRLGSIIAITDEAGNITEQRSYDAWGKRRNLNGTPMTNAFTTPFERHGFTGHEEMDEIGLIHMNGRIYDPAIGRFMTADSVVQFPNDMQNYNRYSYINNNPMLTTDPSGHLFGFDDFLIALAITFVAEKAGIIDSKIAKALYNIEFAVYMGPKGAGGIYGASHPITNAVVISTKALIDSRGDLGAILKNEFQQYAMNYVGGKWDADTEWAKNALGHSAVGCAYSAMNGSSCLSGALAGGFSGLADGQVGNQVSNPLAATMVSAAVGGTASLLGGGKFENGAMTGAYGYLYNYLAHGHYLSNKEGQLVVDQAAKWKDTPYKYIGAKSEIQVGGDCSGTTFKIYDAIGDPYDYKTADNFAAAADKEGFPFQRLGANDALQPGDVLHFPGHLAIYAGHDAKGNDLMWSASTSKQMYVLQQVQYFGRPLIGTFRYQVPDAGH